MPSRLACLHGEAITPLSKVFWRVLRQLGVWSHPLYLAYKATQTAISDVRDVVPECVIKLSYPISATSIFKKKMFADFPFHVYK